VAREAVDWWLRQQFREVRRDAIEAYAVEIAGSHLDLDADLESANRQAKETKLNALQSRAGLPPRLDHFELLRPMVLGIEPFRYRLKPRLMFG
jgi:hypothetical protein